MINNVFAFFKAVSVFVVVVCFVGCDGGSGLSPVKGTITLDGKPYPSAQVRFVPESGRPSIGITDESGVYTLTYIRDEKGAAPGNYKVDVTTVYVSESDTSGKVPPEKVPSKYNTLTELKATVEPGENVIDFDLMSR
jgi:hypothetical protein